MKTLSELQEKLQEVENTIAETHKVRTQRVGDLDTRIAKLRQEQRELNVKIEVEQRRLRKKKVTPKCTGTFRFKDGTEFRSYAPITIHQNGRSLMDFMDMVSTKGLPVDYQIIWS